MPNLYAQSQITNEEEAPKLPQWVRDLRRWDIITFGVFPFSMFFVTFAADMIRWSETDFSDNRYAPWPMKSKDAVAMTSEEYLRTVLIGISVSAAIALIDFAIVQIKRSVERKRLEDRTSGTYTIEKRSVHDPQENKENVSENDESGTAGKE